MTQTVTETKPVNAIVGRNKNGDFVGFLSRLPSPLSVAAILDVAHAFGDNEELIAAGCKENRSIVRQTVEAIIGAFRQMECERVFIYLGEGTHWKVYEFAKSKWGEPSYLHLADAVAKWREEAGMEVVPA